MCIECMRLSVLSGDCFFCREPFSVTSEIYELNLENVNEMDYQAIVDNNRVEFSLEENKEEQSFENENGNEFIPNDEDFAAAHNANFYFK